MSSLTDIQQAFVRRYMDDGSVVGVRVRELDNRMVLYVEVESGHGPVDLPATFRDVPVVVREGRRAILAYA
jgi:hypothetical protein